MTDGNHVLIAAWGLGLAMGLIPFLARVLGYGKKRGARDFNQRRVIEAEENLQSIFSSLPDSLIIADSRGLIRSLNPKTGHYFGYTIDQVRGEPVDGLLAEPYAHALRRRWKAWVDKRDPALTTGCREVLARHGKKGVFPVEMSIARIHQDGEELFVVVLHDLSLQKRALARLNVAEKVLECTMEGVMVTDRSSVIQWVNPGFCRISGYSRADVLGQHASILRSGLHDQDFYTHMWEKIAQSGEWDGEIRNRRKDGQFYHEWLTIKAITDPSGQIIRYVGVFSDISKHKEAEETIRNLTYYDAVTHLPNRDLLMDRLAQALERAPRAGRKVALVMIGLDRFTQINESLGHATGDHLLRAVAERLAAALRGHDSVARLRGDTFCCLLTDLAQGHDAHLVISRLLDCFTQSFHLAEHEVFVTAKVGISVFPVDSSDPDDLVLKAEMAMIRSKELGDNQYHFYTPEMHANSIERLRLETELRKALSRNEFELHYQPKISTDTGHLVGAEALIRWRHHELGPIPPGRFIPMAEETGLIVSIGSWVIGEACRQIAQWRAEGLEPVQLAVNLSAHQFRQADLVPIVAQAMKSHGIPPELLQMEVTESAVMHNADSAIAILTELHSHGVHLAIDDFGTGYSSLSYLKKFPLDTLKIDRSFVIDIDTNPASAEIVGAIIAMGHSLSLDIVAEGVENDAQLDILRNLHCDTIQGFYYSRPLPADAFAAVLKLGRMDGGKTTDGSSPQPPRPLMESGMI